RHTLRRLSHGAEPHPCVAAGRGCGIPRLPPRRGVVAAAHSVEARLLRRDRLRDELSRREALVAERAPVADVVRLPATRPENSADRLEETHGADRSAGAGP